MRFLITGGAGFLGSHLVDALVTRGDEVVVLDDLSTGRRENIEHHLEFEQVELVDGSGPRRRAREQMHGPGRLVHASGQRRGSPACGRQATRLAPTQYQGQRHRGNGTQSRCFAHVFDTVHALLLLMDSEQATGRVYNVGCPTEVAIVELARRVIERSESSSTVTFVPYEDAYGEGFEELGRRKPDITAMTEATGWHPSRDVDEAIDDVVAYERSTGSSAGRLRLAG